MWRRARAIDWPRARIGDAVLAPGGGRGTLLSLPDRSGRIRVQVAGAKLTISRDQLGHAERDTGQQSTTNTTRLSEGPLPPDTCFLPWRREATDCFICMYHDQGHIQLKALAFDKAINVTLGLPIIRTSVDHGTACDIAWQGKAKPSSRD